MKPGTLDTISPESARTLAGLFHERVKRTPESAAYHYFDQHNNAWQEKSWIEMARHIGRWQGALQRESLQAGDRVAVMLHNCCQWVMFDQAALGLGLVVVPLYVNDRADNIVHILQETGTKILLISGQEHWQLLQPVAGVLSDLDKSALMRIPCPAPGTADVVMRYFLLRSVKLVSKRIWPATAPLLKARKDSSMQINKPSIVLGSPSNGVKSLSLKMIGIARS